MNRRSHECHANGAALEDQLRELVGPELLEPRPESDVGRGGNLRLHADESLDRSRCGHLLPSEKHLPREQRAVERAPAEHRIWLAIGGPRNADSSGWGGHYTAFSR